MPVFKRKKKILRPVLLFELLFLRVDVFVLAEDIGVFFFIS
ncbi:hypothetical protein AQPE_5010 [Aquipluma nitroreducens]|uniref:Uncharacterized protein n=1 Tax=Aquipluma nitroreducens TaxID=2010828 RepID=A0A5K7SH34_9BACT|nr:hypothetical protein AQPE_5010 [Aquipluma nitroreducens]